MKRNIVVLNDYAHANGGASRIAIDEAIGLAAAGERVIFFAACGPVCAELQAAPLEVICLNQRELIEAGKSPTVMMQGLWNAAAGRRMHALLASLDPAATVVHLHGYTKALTTSPVRAAVKRGFRVVCTLHDFFTACPNGAFFDYPSGKPCGRRAMSLDCISANCDKRHYAHKLYRVARAGVQKHVGLLPDGVRDYITLSERSAALLRPYLPGDARYHPLENLIDVAQLPPVDAAANEAIMAVGRLDVEKGIETLLEASAGSGMKLILVGDGPLRAQAEAYPHCRVTGWLPPEAVFAELANARCLAFPSLWYETYGLVVAEAASRGIPAIVSAISAAAERVTDRVHGWHMQPGDAGDLARCFAITRDDAAIRAAGQAAYVRFWEKPPTRQAHIAGLLGIYDALFAQVLSS